jgi:hypothetical protein
MLSKTTQSVAPTYVPSSSVVDQKNFTPGSYDVLVTRSRTAYKHVGNRRFKIIIELNAPTYAMAKTKMDKSLIVASVLNIVQSAGGNFMRKNRKTSVWEVAPVVTSQEKIGHSLRMAVKAAADDKARSIYDVMGTGSDNKKKLSKLSVPDGTAVPQSILSYILMENFSRRSHSSTNNEEKNDQSQGDLIDSFLGSDDVKAVGGHPQGSLRGTSLSLKYRTYEICCK